MAPNSSRDVTLTLLTLCFIVNGIFGAKLFFSPGKEYVYNYVTVVTTGTEAPVGYAAAYKIDGNLRVQAENSNLLNVKLEDVTIGLYNGPWTYFPLPEFQKLSNVDLSSLTEPFQIHTENGKFKTLVMNDQEQEWVSNMKRGLANYLQMDLNHANFDQVHINKVSEMTIMGECDTTYEVLPITATKAGTARINKFRNHADCLYIPSRVRQAAKIFYPCQDETTKNLINSTAYASYDIDDSLPDEIRMKQLIVYSSILYWPFTTKASYLYTWFNLHLALREVTSITNVLPPPENPETHEDLSFVFEQNDQNDPEDESIDLKAAEPLMFHHTAGESDADTLANLMEQLHKSTKLLGESFLAIPDLKDQEKFHRSPFQIIPLISSLDYESLKHCNEKYSAAAAAGGELEKVEFQIFLDGLLLAGTSPSTLLLRDIILQNENTAVLTRIIPSLPLYTRNPSELLAKEFSAVFELSQTSKLPKSLRRLLELSLASLVFKSCKKTLCIGTGALDKYIDHFSQKLASDDYETQTVGVLGLRNLGLGRAVDILTQVATGVRKVEKSARVHAIWSLRPLCSQGDGEPFKYLLPIFYDRSEPCETRASVFGFLMSCNPDERVLHEIAYFMWTETCPQTSNYVRTTLKNMATAEYPCARVSKASAKTILEYLPPGKVDPTRSSSYTSHYYNKDHAFGQGVTTSVIKTGRSALPVSVYLGFDGIIGGYAAHYLGLYIRMEGLGKAVSNQLANMRNADISEIQRILSTIGVKTRSETPLRLELCVMYHLKAVAFYTFDEKKIAELPKYVEALGELLSEGNVNWERSLLLGGSLYQQPMEIGVPISVLTSAAASYRVKASITREKESGVLNRNSDARIQFNTFGITQIMNHFVGIGTTFSAVSQRSARISISRKSSIGIDSKNYAIKFTAKPSSEDNPAILAMHATTKTTVSRDSAYTADPKTLNLLKSSCPNCEPEAIASRGKSERNTKTVTYKPKLVSGVKAQMTYFDCERKISKASAMKKLWNYFGNSGKSGGISPFWSIQAAFDQTYLAPSAETCGLAISLSQDSESGPALQQITGMLTGRIEPGKRIKVEGKAHFKYGEDTPDQVIEAHAKLRELQVDDQTLDLKIISKKGDSGKILCLTTTSETRTLPKDSLSFTDENEPIMKQKFHLSLGTIAGDQYSGRDTACASDHVDVTIEAEAKRSDEQIFISEQDVGPYKVCRDEADSELYPGNYVPPTIACNLAVQEQTALRDVKFDINYKINSNVEKRWRGISSFLRGLLYPYSEDEDETVAKMGVSPGYAASGELSVRFNLSYENPTLDADLRAGGKPEEHYRNVDLGVLPRFLSPQPVASRVSNLWATGQKFGAFASCSAYPSIVHTFDGVSVEADLPECLTLISADCGKKPQYAVLAKRVSPSNLDLLVLIADSTLELGGTGVKLNGQSVELEERKAADFPAKMPPNFRMMKNGDEIQVYSRFLGVWIRYTGNFVTVTLGSRYRAIHCGLCGHWDSTPTNDVNGPDYSCPNKALKPQEFFNSYVLREGDCEAVGSACPE